MVVGANDDGCSSSAPLALIFLFRDRHEATSDVVTGRDRRMRRDCIPLLLLILLVVVAVVSASRRRRDLPDAVSFVSAVEIL